MPDLPLAEAEFAALMAPLGPWDGRRLAVAVSGGADSLALALLLARWAGAGRLLGLVVDHGLRPEAAAEAALTGRRLAGLGVASRVLRLVGLAAGPGLAARARRARYDALLGACRAEGVADLLLGHHAGDQAETVLLRLRAGSGPHGLAGMAPAVALPAARLLRPLLTVPPGRLRATLRAAGLPWVEDPSNADPRAARAGLRRELAGEDAAAAGLLALAGRASAARGAAEREAAAFLAGAELRPEGFALLPAVAPPPLALAALLRVLGGAEHAPAPAAVARLAAMLGRPPGGPGEGAGGGGVRAGADHAPDGACLRGATPDAAPDASDGGTGDAVPGAIGDATGEAIRGAAGGAMGGARAGATGGATRDAPGDATGGVTDGATGGATRGATGGATRGATLGGVRVLPAGRLGPGWLLCREAAAMAPAVVATDGALWDGRFRLRGRPPPGAELGALGGEAARLRRRPGLPMAVLRTLPALRVHGMLVVVPHLDYCADPMCAALRIPFSPGRPAAPATPWPGPREGGAMRPDALPGGPA